MPPKMRERWVHCSFEAFRAVNVGSLDPMDVDSKLLDEISLNVF
jgi:hypothetical protein